MLSISRGGNNVRNATWDAGGLFVSRARGFGAYSHIHFLCVCTREYFGENVYIMYTLTLGRRKGSAEEVCGEQDLTFCGP